MTERETSGARELRKRVADAIQNCGHERCASLTTKECLAFADAALSVAAPDQNAAQDDGGDFRRFIAHDKHCIHQRLPHQMICLFCAEEYVYKLATAGSAKPVNAAPTDQLTFRQFLVINNCPYPCPRCLEGTSFEVSLKDRGWIICAACHYIMKSGIDAQPAVPALPEQRGMTPDEAANLKHFYSKLGREQSTEKASELTKRITDYLSGEKLSERQLNLLLIDCRKVFVSMQ